MILPKNHLLSLLFFISTSMASFGQNLVPNPSFELKSACPNDYGYGPLEVLNWHLPMNHGGTSDYFNQCSEKKVGIPGNVFGYQQALQERAYAGFIAVHEPGYWPFDYREYLQVKLRTPLDSGTIYSLYFNVSLAEISKYATNNIGAVFSQSGHLKLSSSSQNTLDAISQEPSCYSKEIIDDTINWVRLDFLYEARGGENFLTIGNFFPDSLCNFEQLSSSSSRRNAYYYLDDVHVFPCFINKDDAFLGNDTVLCSNDSLLLVLDDDLPVLWSDGSTSNTLKITTSGQYWVQVTDGRCTLSDTINVSIENLTQVSIGSDTVLCPSDTIILDAHTSGANYLWQDSSTNPELLAYDSGQYWVKVYTEHCSFRDTVNIVPVPELHPFQVADQKLCLGDTLNLKLDSNIHSAEWSTGNHTDEIQISEAGEYWVTARNSCDTAISYFQVSDSYCGCRVFVPNGFSPNSDGTNDYFKVETNCNIGSYYMSVYNRWGEKLFETSSITDTWNGSYNNSSCQSGMYLYKIALTDLDGSILHYQGIVNLLK